ncbi:hypothetical protein DL89DRAFT_290648 [Linderina pennispora]|uniref:Uncharacterized protein n=1 Tax=Linderina pennispora TaxID=61395 RepID=A0A1Y1WGY5_9FUNG|nr:uncharacterized protein DL89DRAFT_290648 [Linderina pennispora]ORX72821.1 hypothetical protein DL89DRAFT_290648 [Linderina pennispora]
MLLQYACKALAIVSALLVTSNMAAAATANGYKDGRVVLGYIPVQRQGGVVNTTMTSEQHARAVIADGQKNNVKMLVAVGGQGNFSVTLAKALSTPATLSAFVSNAVDFVDSYKLDGIDCDFEICSRQLQGIRKGMDVKFGKGKKLLTITLYNHPFLGPNVPTMDYKPFYEAVDYALVMTYDYFGNWADYSAPNSPKLVAGLPFYGHSILTNQYVPIDDHKTLVGPVSDIAGSWTWKDLRDPAGGALSDGRTARAGWVRAWDNYTMTPWLFRKSDSLYIGYDDEDSLGVKMDYTLRRGLAGVMIWEIGFDYKNELIGYVKDFIQQSDDGLVAKDCAPSDDALDGLFQESRNPNFFNFRSLHRRDEPRMCQFPSAASGWGRDGSGGGHGSGCDRACSAGDKATAEQKFKDISEAFEALSDKNKRAVYDQYGEEGLKGGMGGGGAGGFPGGFGGMGGGGGQSFHFTSGGPGGGFGGFTPSNPEDIFAQLFSGLGGMGGMGGMGGHGVHTHRGRGGHAMDVDDDMGGGFGGRTREVTRPLACTLEELYNGCTKKLKVTRRTLDRASGQLVSSEKILQIDIKPGWKAGTKVRFSGEGDNYGHGAQDIVFVVEAKPHAVYKRDGDNLKMDMELSLDEALCGFKRPVTKLDGKKFMVSNKMVVRPGQISQMDGYGMPISKLPGQVNFPSSLTDSQKEQIHAALTQ